MGMKDWFSRKKKDSVEGLKDNVNYKEVQGTASEIKNMAKNILSPKNQIKNARTETFQNAQMRLNVSEAEIIQNYKNFVWVCYISLFFAFFCFLGAVYNLFFAHSVISALAMISIMLFCLANAFKFSFRSFQIRHQKLCSVKDWWERSNEWIPKLK